MGDLDLEAASRTALTVQELGGGRREGGGSVGGGATGPSKERN